MENYTFSFNANEVQFILAVLGKQPMEQVEGLVNNIRTQVNAINAEREAKRNEKSEPEPTKGKGDVK